MKEKSKLVKALNIVNKTELEELTKTSKPQLRAIAVQVILVGETYTQAGKENNISKNSIYEFLKRIYYKKYKKVYHATP